MVDRANRGVGARLVAFARAVVLLGVIAVGAPIALVVAARERFGGGAPLHGVPSPADWSSDRIRTALTDRLTDQTIADIVIRLALLVAWAGVIVIVLTVVAELVHMVRHDGLSMPDIRGLGFTQRTARLIASGLLVVVPLITSPSGALARSSPALLPERAASPATFEVPEPSETPVGSDAVASAPLADAAAFGGGAAGVRSVAPMEAGVADPAPVAAQRPGTYVVGPGDSIFGIAERLAGPGTSEVASFAERLVELNLGREMPDGRRFTNAAFIDVGWVFELPDGAPSNTAVGSASSSASTSERDPGVHVVEEGETLWSIADEEFGDPQRWPEVFEANEGRTFDDGRRLTDPDLIHPGWALEIPGDADAAEMTPPAVEPDIETGVDAADAPDVTPIVDARTDELAPPAPADRLPDHLADALDVSHRANADTDAFPESPARRDNVWEGAGDGAGSADVGGLVAATDADVHAAPAGAAGGPVGGPGDRADAADRPEVLALGAGAMLSSGVLALLATRRRRQLRRAKPRAELPAPAPRAAATERVLRTIDTGARLDRVETAVRAVAASLVADGARVLAVLVGTDGSLELRATSAVRLPAPWQGSDTAWELAASTPIEMLAEAAEGVAVLSPTLVQLGTADDGRDVYVDLEAVEALEIGGPGTQADAVVAALAATLAGSLLAEVTTLVGLGVPDEAFLGHRHYVPVRDPRQAFDVAAESIGSTAAMTASTFELRCSANAGETWEPAVVLVGAAAGTISPPSQTGLAVVSASPIHGPSSRLAPDGDAWRLLPAGIRLTPVGITPADLDAIAELVTVVEPRPEPEPQPRLDRDALESEHTILPGRFDDDGDGDETPRVGSVASTGWSPPRAATVPADESATESDADAGPAGAPPPTVSHAVAGRVPADIDDRVGAGVEAAPRPHALLIRLLGSVQVVDEAGTEVSFERSKTRELVAWLATHRERSTRGAARTALWELDVRDATFANVVSEARRSLARLVEPPDGDEWVGRTMTEALPLHPLVVTDADLVRDALAAARLQPPAQAIATLAPAVDLIVGMPFEGTSYLWPDSEGITSDLVLLATTATTELAAHRLSIGDVQGVFDATGRGLRVLPGHEELIGLRMEAHARAGDHAGVRQEWESYERVINADPWSDGEPAAKLVELRRQLLNPSR